MALAELLKNLTSSTNVFSSPSSLPKFWFLWPRKNQDHHKLYMLWPWGKCERDHSRGLQLKRKTVTPYFLSLSKRTLAFWSILFLWKDQILDSNTFLMSNWFKAANLETLSWFLQICWAGSICIFQLYRFLWPTWNCFLQKRLFSGLKEDYWYLRLAFLEFQDPEQTLLQTKYCKGSTEGLMHSFVKAWKPAVLKA